MFAADNEPSLRLGAMLRGAGIQLLVATSYDQCLDLLAGQSFDVVVVDPATAGARASELAARFYDPEQAAQLVCVCLTPVSPAAYPELSRGPFPWLEDNTVSCAQAVALAAERARLLRENRLLKRRLSQRRLREIIGHSPAIEALRGQITRAAAEETPVLIHGEKGTGKELVARAIHDASERAYRPFIKVDCSVLTSTTLEAELYGNPETPGSGNSEPGRLAMADGGILLLDEVCDISLPLQLKLIRTLQGRRIEAPGGHGSIPLNVRVIATSSAVLAERVARGLFRADLYEYLNGLVIRTPALREHPEDIAQLTEHFLNQVAVREGKLVRRIPVDTLQLLRSYDWPGNVRELENVIDRACAVDVGTRLTVEMVQPWLAASTASEETAPVSLSLREMERKLIESTFARLGGNRERTAQALQIGLRTLSGKLREYGYPPRGGPGSNQTRSENRAA